MPGAATPLIGEYETRVLADDEFQALFREYRPRVFGETFVYDPAVAMEADERAASARLRERLAARYRLNLGVYRGDEFVGWTFGLQESPLHDVYYMVNSAVLEPHRGRGIYSALIPRVVEAARREGFQIVRSRHAATNNRVLVPKLKAGFVITGMELSDVFGTLVHLSYFLNPTRRKVLDVRAGQSRPDADVRRVLPLD
jgi:GNAT superfamily N-acetyltransferase